MMATPYTDYLSRALTDEVLAEMGRAGVRSNSEMSRLSGVRYSLLNRSLGGGRDLKAAELGLICDALGANLLDIFDRAHRRARLLAEHDKTEIERLAQHIIDYT